MPNSLAIDYNRIKTMKKLTSYIGAISLATLLTCSTALAQAANGDQNTAGTTPKAQAEVGKGQPASNPQRNDAQTPSQTQTAKDTQKDAQASRDTSTAQTTTRDVTRGTGNSNPGRVSETQPRGMSDKWAEGKDTANNTRDSAHNSNPGRIPVARDTKSSLLKNTASSTVTRSDNVARSSDKTTAPNPSRPAEGSVSASPNSP
jgi:hypothetical protein